MKASVTRGAAALALWIGLVAGAPSASAQTPAPLAAAASPEQARLGVQFSEKVLGVMDLDAIFTRSLTNSLAGPNGEFVKIEPK